MSPDEDEDPSSAATITEESESVSKFEALDLPGLHL